MQSKIENIDLGDLSGEHWKKASLILRNACLSIADEADRQEKLACLDMLETELKNNNSNMDDCCLFFPRNHFVDSVFYSQQSPFQNLLISLVTLFPENEQLLVPYRLSQTIGYLYDELFHDWQLTRTPLYANSLDKLDDSKHFLERAWINGFLGFGFRFLSPDESEQQKQYLLGSSPALDAIRSNKINLLGLALHGSPGLTFHESHKCICEAASSGNIDMVRMVLQLTSDPANANNNTPLRNAAKNGHLEIVRHLLNFESVNPNDFNNDAIKQAAQSNHLDLIWILATYKGLKDNHADQMVVILEEQYKETAIWLKERLQATRDGYHKSFPYINQVLSINNADCTPTENGTALTYDTKNLIGSFFQRLVEKEIPVDPKVFLQESANKPF